MFLGDARRIFQRNGKFYEPGEIFRQPELARTLERIAPILKPMSFTKAQWRANWLTKSSAAAD